MTDRCSPLFKRQTSAQTSGDTWEGKKKRELLDAPHNFTSELQFLSEHTRSLKLTWFFSVSSIFFSELPILSPTLAAPAVAATAAAMTAATTTVATVTTTATTQPQLFAAPGNSCCCSGDHSSRSRSCGSSISCLLLPPSPLLQQ